MLLIPGNLYKCYYREINTDILRDKELLVFMYIDNNKWIGGYKNPRSAQLELLKTMFKGTPKPYTDIEVYPIEEYIVKQKRVLNA